MTPAPSATLEELLARRDDLVRFVRRRVESDAAAEEIVQAAFLRSVEHDGSADDADSATAWFYRVLRNAIVDHYRRRNATGRALEQLALELPAALAETPADERDRVCTCVRKLTATLKPEYADILEEVDVVGHPIALVAKTLRITANNATVRLHRARKALRDRVLETCRACAEHGCIDCSCRPA